MLLTTGSLEGRHLGGDVLIVGGESGVADLLSSNLSPIKPLIQYFFATQECPKPSAPRFFFKKCSFLQGVRCTEWRSRFQRQTIAERFDSPVLGPSFTPLSHRWRWAIPCGSVSYGRAAC